MNRTVVFTGSITGAWFGLIAIGPAGALIFGPAIDAAALLGNSTVRGAAQKHLMSEWHSDLRGAAEELHASIVAVRDRRIVRLEQRSDAFATNAAKSDLDAWMARKAQDDLIAALENRASLTASRPKAEADAIRLLFSAREMAPADAAVLSQVQELEQKIARKPGLKAEMMEAGRPASDMLRSYTKGRWFHRRETETSDSEP